jgi:MFS family permease
MSMIETVTPVWRRPGVILIAGCVVALISFGLRSTFGLFMEPLSDARGWGREIFAFAIALQNLVWGLGQPFAGALADRLGAARTLAGGGLLYALGIALMAYTDSPLGIALSGGVVVGLGLAGASFTVVLAAVGRLVPDSRRSVALGITTAAGSFGQFVFAPLGQAFIGGYGWASALMLLAVIALLMPLCAPPLASRGGTAAAGEREVGFAEALRIAAGHRSYWLLNAGFFVCGFQLAFITVHLPPYLADLGISAGLAAWTIAIIGLFNVIGAFTSGVLGGRHSRRMLLSLLYLGRALATAAFLLAPKTPAVILLFGAIMGLLWLSTVPLTSGLVTVMFGTRYMGTLFGVVFFSHQLGAFIGVWLGGRIHEVTGSYDPIWWLAVVLALFAALIHWPIVERRAPALTAEA